ncbi:hypothetical protein H5U35_03140, partial [Candidatus Aerophobetes bacterium]|nr:hypothetical protein [Candidatus Aerophobetes bacterium]
MKKLYFILTGILTFTLILSSSACWAGSSPSSDEVAKLQQAINEAHKLAEKIHDAYFKAGEEAWEKAYKIFKEEYAKAKTQDEKREAWKRLNDNVDKFLEEKLKEINWEKLKKAKDEAFQKIIEEIDKVYDIDTKNVKGEPTFDQNQSEEGLCWPDGTVKLGPSAFKTPGFVAATKKHE